jgi:DNA-binding transcriptional LysR family regulator
MNLDWIEDFLALARECNFSRAAERRNVTQPAFSRRIHALEHWLGAPLFVRTPQGTTLTPAGDVMTGYAEGIVRDLHRAQTAVLEATGRADATLTFAATHALSFTFFPNWIRKHAPHETLNLMSDSMEACEQIMLRGDASFLLYHRHPAVETAFDTRRFARLNVGEDTLVPVCIPNDGGRPKWELRTDCAGEPIPHLAYSSPSGLGRILKADWEQQGHRFNLTTVMTSRLAAALLTMSREGQGIAWLPKSLVEDDLKLGRLVAAGRSAYSTTVDIALARPIARLSASSEHFWKTLM